MKRFWMILTLLVAGCGPMAAFDRPGVSVTRLAKDLNGCEASAFEFAPPNVIQQTRWRTDFRPVPVCYAGYCDFYYDRRWVPEIYSVDVNAGARQSKLLSCMANKGYLLVEVPRCTAQQQQAVSLTRNSKQAPLSNTACGVNLQGVGPLIVDPAAGGGLVDTTTR